MKRIALIALALAFAATAAAQTPVPDSALKSPKASARPVPAAPTLGAESYILVDFNSGRVLVEHNADLRVEPASITKLMTAYVVFHELDEGNITLQETVPISEKAWRTGGSRMFIDPKMQVSVEDLIRGMVIQSGNDACVALAEHVAGSEEAFAELMNMYAQRLGMTATNFRNSTGLPDPDHYTTARDIAILSAATIRDFPDFYGWYSEKEFTFNNIRQHNRNTLLWRDPAIDGLKTGHTEAAGYCLAASAKRDGMRLISAVMGSSSESSRASETQTLLNYGFRFFETHRLYSAGEILNRSRVWKGDSEKVSLGLLEDLYITIPRGSYGQLEAVMDVDASIVAPLDKGSQHGAVRVNLAEEEMLQAPLVALESVNEGSLFQIAKDHILQLFN